MAFGSNDFPLGPNGQFPRQRVGNFGNRIAAPNRVEDMYRGSVVSRLPVVEKDYNSSVERAKRRMKMGSPMRKGQDENKFTPRHMMLTPITRSIIPLVTPVKKAGRMNVRAFSGGLSGWGSKLGTRKVYGGLTNRYGSPYSYRRSSGPYTSSSF